MNDPNVIYGGDFENRDDLQLASLGELVTTGLQRGGARHGFINGLTGESWSYEQLLSRSIRVSLALHSVGVRQNDMISIVSENRHEFMAVACGTFLLNAVFAPLNSTYTERELRHAFGLIRPKVVFASASCIDNVVAVSAASQLIVTIDNSEHASAITLREFTTKHSSRNTIDIHELVRRKVNREQQTAMIFQSSGTTGTPKGVEITQMNILACMQSYHDNLRFLKVYDENICNLGIAPWSHVMGFMGTFFSIMSCESTFVFLPKFDAELYLRCLEKYKITIIAVPPPIVVFLTKTPLFDKYDLSKLKVIFCGAAPLSKDVERAVIERFKNRVIVCQGYGMSETTLAVLGTYEQLKPGTVGKVFNETYAKVVDPNGKSLGPNKVGELCFKGSRIMKGYLGNPKATAETIDSEGWLHTGDLGYYDDEFQFYIVDRLKELIKYKAFQVPPAEIEGLLLSHPNVKDVGVIGIPDESAGELPFAFVVRQPDAELTEREVKDFVAKNASNAKWLRGGVRFVDDIPKNPSGKILRRELRELHKSTRAKL